MLVVTSICCTVKCLTLKCYIIIHWLELPYTFLFPGHPNIWAMLPRAHIVSYCWFTIHCKMLDGKYCPTCLVFQPSLDGSWWHTSCWLPANSLQWYRLNSASPTEISDPIYTHHVETPTPCFHTHVPIIAKAVCCVVLLCVTVCTCRITVNCLSFHKFV